MTNVTTKPDSSQPQTETAVHLFDNWFDPIEAGLRDRAREFLQAMLEGELDMVLARSHSLAVRSRRAAMRREWSAPLVTATATGRGRCWGVSAKWRSRCRITVTVHSIRTPSRPLNIKYTVTVMKRSPIPSTSATRNSPNGAAGT
jgi:hypothetical protein